jgi:hypothetical protein
LLLFLKPLLLLLLILLLLLLLLPAIKATPPPALLLPARSGRRRRRRLGRRSCRPLRTPQGLAVSLGIRRAAQVLAEAHQVSQALGVAGVRGCDGLVPGWNKQL